MSNLILFDDDNRDHLLPLTFMRPTAELRCGALTIREKWERALGLKASYITQEYLSEKFPIEISEDNLVINGTALPNERLLKLIRELDFNEALLQDEDLIAVRLNQAQFDHLIKNEQVDQLVGFELKHTKVTQVKRPFDLFTMAGKELIKDISPIISENNFQPSSSLNRVMGDQLYIEEGADVRNCILNTETGPIFISGSALVMEGSILRGPLYVGPGAVIKMGAKIYGPTIIGPYSKVGGEVNNVVFQAYSNKGHEGFLGNSVLAEWCNLGADTNTSNLKNNYDLVKLWSYPEAKFISTGLQFCGLIMGDHSKAGINTMFNTGTTVGVSSNIFGSGYPRNFIDSFQWGGPAGFKTYRLDKALETAERVMSRRDKQLTSTDVRIFEHLHSTSG